MAQYRSEVEAARTEVERLRGESETDAQAADTAQNQVQPLEDISSPPQIAIVASYRLKRSRVSGTTRINLNKFTSLTMPIRFDHNLGDLRRFLDSVTTVVDVGSTEFQRRQILVGVDASTEEYAKVVNSATVTLRKRHENGDVSEDSVSVTRNSVDNEANALELSYNRLEDGRDAPFRTYEYNVQWNYRGGLTSDEPFRESSEDTITIFPRYGLFDVSIDADPGRVAAEQIRAIDITLFEPLGDGGETPINFQLIPRSDGTGLSAKRSIVMPIDSVSFDYELTWILNTGETRTSGRRTHSSSLLFVDSL